MVKSDEKYLKLVFQTFLQKLKYVKSIFRRKIQWAVFSPFSCITSWSPEGARMFTWIQFKSWCFSWCFVSYFLVRSFIGRSLPGEVTELILASFSAKDLWYWSLVSWQSHTRWTKECCKIQRVTMGFSEESHYKYISQKWKWNYRIHIKLWYLSFFCDKYQVCCFTWWCDWLGSRIHHCFLLPLVACV